MIRRGRAPADPGSGVDQPDVDGDGAGGGDVAGTAVAADPARTRQRSWRHGAASIGAGLLVGLSLPPWGWWPLAFAGLALYSWLLRGRRWKSRWSRGFLFTLGWLGPGMAWMWFLTPPGYIIAVAIFAVVHATAAAVAPPGRSRWLGLPAAFTLAEALRFCFPFGGVPLASLAISQVAGPLAPIARVGGPLLMTFVTMVAAQGLLALITRTIAALERSVSGAPTATRDADGREGSLVPLLATVIVVGGLIGVGGIRMTHSAGRSIRVAFVQGGGPQGTHAIDTDSRLVVARHIAATDTLQPGPDLVVWPENVINVANFADSVERTEVAAEAKRLNAPVLVGVTEDTGDGKHFLNAQVVVLPDGSLGGRYDKVRRVPFGEYVPMRSVLEAVGAPLEAIPRDAVAGTGPAYLDTPVGRIAVVISWEVFFAGRARDGVKHGGELLINPTNGSSYTWTILQSQQVASSRLRAIETDRWVVQASPTGFSAFVSPSGDVMQRTSVSEQAVRQQTVELRTGETLAVRIGDKPWVAVAFVLLLVAILLDRRHPDRHHRGHPESASTEST